MSMSGRKPIPASLIDPLEHKKSKDEIETRQKIENALKTSSKLTCPKYLSITAKKEWRRVIKLYRGLDVDILCDLDISALVIYCEAWAIYKQAQSIWAKYIEKVQINPESKSRMPEKYFIIMKEQSKIINSVSEQLCLTPVGRARMGMMARKDAYESDVEALFNEDD